MVLVSSSLDRLEFLDLVIVLALTELFTGLGEILLVLNSSLTRLAVLLAELAFSELFAGLGEILLVLDISLTRLGVLVVELEP